MEKEVRNSRMKMAAVLLLLLIMTTVSGNAIPLVLATAIILFAVLQMLQNLCSRNRLMFSFEEGGIRVKNASFFSIPKLKLCLEIKNDTTGTRTAQSVFGFLQGRETKFFAWEQEHKVAGFYEIWLQEVRLRDAFGVTNIVGKPAVYHSRIIMPALHMGITDAPEKTADLKQDGGLSGVRSEYGDMVSIREYTAGDTLRQIHFKMSAKFDSLYVRESEAGAVREQMLIYETLDLASDRRSEEEVIKRLEDFFSEAFALIQDGISYQMVWYDGIRKQLECHKIESTDALLEAMHILLRCERTVSEKTTEQIAAYHRGMRT